MPPPSRAPPAGPAALLLLLLALLLLPLPALALAAPGPVTAVTATAAAASCQGNSSCDLQSLVNQGVGTIWVYGTIVLPATLVVSSSVTIAGALNNAPEGASLEGNQNFRLVQVLPGFNLTLVNLVLTLGASNDGQGGAAVLLGQGANLVADGCIFVQNFATGSGGAISTAQKSIVRLTRSTFQYNSAAQGDAGAIFLQSSTLFMDQCLLLNNAAYYMGGALSAELSYLYVSNSTWMGNSAQRGGAVASWASPYMILYANTFASNVASYGGALHVSDNIMAVVLSLFQANQADDANSQAVELLITTDGSGAHMQTLFTNCTFSPPLSSGSLYVSPLSGLGAISSCSSANSFPDLPVFGCGTGASCANAPSPGVSCVCGGASPASSLPVVCSSLPYRAALPPATKPCFTSGGYVADNTPCVFPFTISYGSGKTAKKYVVDSCQPVVAGLPYESTTPRTGTANGFWCSTVAKYSPEDTTSRKSWGFCGLSCGYVDPVVMTHSPFTPTPTGMPTMGGLSTLTPTSVQSNPPLLVLVRYGGQYGSRIELYFDRATNCGGGNLCAGSVFSCSQLLFVNTPSDICQWISSNTLYMYPSYPYANVTLLPNVISNPAGGPPFSSGSMVVIGGGVLLGTPSVSIAAPANISRCLPLVLDGSLSSAATLGGIASHAWSLVSVLPSLPDVSGLVNVLANCSATLVCSVGTLPYPGLVFTFALTITNFFEVSSQGNVVVSVIEKSKPSQLAVSISFATGSSITAPMDSSTAPTLTDIAAFIRITGCGNAPYVPHGLNLRWAVSNPPSVNSSLVLIPTLDPWVVAFNPVGLGLGPSNALPITVTVSLTASIGTNASTTSSLAVRVVQTPLVLAILNANRTVAVNTTSPYLLIGTVVSGARLAQESLSFVWSCTIVRGTQGETCSIEASGVLLNDPATSRAELVVSLPNRRYNILLQVYSSARPGQVVSSMAYIVTSASVTSSAVQLVQKSTGTSYPFDASRVRATGTCASTEALPSWNVTDQQGGSVNILAIVSKGVVLPPYALTSGGSYVFQIGCMEQAYSQTTVSVNRPPSSGAVLVAPSEGSVTEVTFSLSTFGWQGDNLPFRYVFTGIDDTGAEFVLTPLTSFDSWQILLPFQTYGVVARVVDSLGTLSIGTAPFLVSVGLPNDANTWFINQIPIWMSDVQFVQRSGGLILAEVAMAASIMDFVDAPQNISSFLRYATVSMLEIAVDAMIIDWTTSQALSGVLAAMPPSFLSSLDADSAGLVVSLLSDGQGLPSASWLTLSSVAQVQKPLNLTCTNVSTTVDTFTLLVIELAQSLFCPNSNLLPVAEGLLVSMKNLAAQVLAGSLPGEPSVTLLPNSSALSLWNVGHGNFSVVLSTNESYPVTITGSSQEVNGSVWIAGQLVQPLWNQGQQPVAFSNAVTLGGSGVLSGFTLTGIVLKMDLTPSNIGSGLVLFDWDNGTSYIATLGCFSYTGRNCTVSTLSPLNSSTVECQCGPSPSSALTGADHVVVVGLRAVPLANFSLTLSPTSPPPTTNMLMPAQTPESFQQGWAACVVLFCLGLACILLLLILDRVDAKEFSRYERGVRLALVSVRVRDAFLARLALNRMRALVVENVRLVFNDSSSPSASMDPVAVSDLPSASQASSLIQLPSVDSSAAAAMAPASPASPRPFAPRPKPASRATTLRIVASFHPWLAPFRAFDRRRHRAAKMLTVCGIIFINAGLSACFLTLLGGDSWIVAGSVSAVCAGLAVWIVDGLAMVAWVARRRRCLDRGSSAREENAASGGAASGQGQKAKSKDEFAIADLVDPALEAGLSSHSDSRASASSKLQRFIATKNFSLDRRAPWMRIVPTMVLSLLGALLAVVWNLSVAGEGLVGAWLAAFAAALVLDMIVVEVLVALLRLGLALLVRRRLSAQAPSTKKPTPSISTPSSSVAQPSHEAVWLPRSRSGDDESLVGMLVEVASMDSDAEARGLLNMILGSESDHDDNDEEEVLQRHYHVPGDTDSSHDGGGGGGSIPPSRPQSQAGESQVSSNWVSDAPLVECIIGEMIV